MLDARYGMPENTEGTEGTERNCGNSTAKNAKGTPFNTDGQDRQDGETGFRFQVAGCRFGGGNEPPMNTDGHGWN